MYLYLLYKLMLHYFISKKNSYILCILRINRYDLVAVGRIKNQQRYIIASFDNICSPIVSYYRACNVAVA